TLRGEHARILVLAATAAGALRDWQPPPELADEARAAVAVMLANSLMTGGLSDEPLRVLLRRLGPGDDPALGGLVRVGLAYDWADMDASAERLERLAEGDDRSTALTASQWLTHLLENEGDLAGATRTASRTLMLVRDEDGPWSTAMAHVLLAELTMHVGDRAAAVRHCRTAL